MDQSSQQPHPLNQELLDSLACSAVLGAEQEMEPAPARRESDILGPQLQMLAIDGPGGIPSSTPTTATGSNNGQVSVAGQSQNRVESLLADIMAKREKLALERGELPSSAVEAAEELTAFPTEDTPGIFDPPPEWLGSAESWRRRVQDAFDHIAKNPRQCIFDKVVAKVHREWIDRLGKVDVSPLDITQEYIDADEKILSESTYGDGEYTDEDAEMDDEADDDVDMEG